MILRIFLHCYPALYNIIALLLLYILLGLLICMKYILTAASVDGLQDNYVVQMAPTTSPPNPPMTPDIAKSTMATPKSELNIFFVMILCKFGQYFQNTFSPLWQSLICFKRLMSL